MGRPCGRFTYHLLPFRASRIQAATRCIWIRRGTPDEVASRWCPAVGQQNEERSTSSLTAGRPRDPRLAGTTRGTAGSPCSVGGRRGVRRAGWPSEGRRSRSALARTAVTAPREFPARLSVTQGSRSPIRGASPPQIHSCDVPRGTLPPAVRPTSAPRREQVRWREPESSLATGTGPRISAADRGTTWTAQYRGRPRASGAYPRAVGFGSTVASR
jgi:hypothetical protein